MDIKVESPRIQKQEYFSDNSVSLPGMGQSGPVGFEPGMFKKEGDSRHKVDPSGKVTITITIITWFINATTESSNLAVFNTFQIKKKKKDKKKHKHKHKHKHEHKHNKDKKEKDPNKLKIREETLSSMSSTPSPNPLSLGGAETI